MSSIKTVKVNFRELSNSVTAEVSITEAGPAVDEYTVLEEAQELYLKATRFSTQETMRKSMK